MEAVGWNRLLFSNPAEATPLMQNEQQPRFTNPRYIIWEMVGFFVGASSGLLLHWRIGSISGASPLGMLCGGIVGVVSVAILLRMLRR